MDIKIKTLDCKDGYGLCAMEFKEFRFLLCDFSVNFKLFNSITTCIRISLNVTIMKLLFTHFSRFYIYMCMVVVTPRTHLLS